MRDANIHKNTPARARTLYRHFLKSRTRATASQTMRRIPQSHTRLLCTQVKLSKQQEKGEEEEKTVHTKRFSTRHAKQQPLAHKKKHETKYSVGSDMRNYDPQLIEEPVEGGAQKLPNRFVYVCLCVPTDRVFLVLDAFSVCLYVCFVAPLPADTLE